MLISNPLEKIASWCEKSYQQKKWRKTGVFLLLLLYAKGFGLYGTFWGGELFCNFFYGSKSASNFAFYDSNIEFLPKFFFLISALVAIFEESRTKRVKKLKMYML
jgi:hypothetical protein